MLEFTSLDDMALLKTIKTRAARERREKFEMVELIGEVDKRRSYLAWGFGSTEDFCIKELKYSETSAKRRLAAMQLIREIPQLEEKICDGSQNLMTISKAQSLFRTFRKAGKPYLIQDKKEFLASIENKSKREVDQIIADKLDIHTEGEKIIALKNNKFRIIFQIDEVVLNKIEKFKSLISHTNPDSSLADCIELMADLALSKLDKTKRPSRSSAQPPVTSRVRHIPAGVQREVWRRAEDKCEFVSDDTGCRCSSTHKLEIDHIITVAHGGTSEISNLRLACRAHNQYYARKVFGDKHMDKFSKKRDQTISL